MSTVPKTAEDLKQAADTPFQYALGPPPAFDLRLETPSGGCWDLFGSRVPQSAPAGANPAGKNNAHDGENGADELPAAAGEVPKTPPKEPNAPKDPSPPSRPVRLPILFWVAES